jgi:iron(III) transport system permease protein
VLNTVLLGAIVTAAALLIGVPLAWFTARHDYPGKAIVAILPLATLVVPEVIAAQTWLMMVGNNGLVTRTLAGVGIELPSFYGWTGLVTVMTLHLLHLRLHRHAGGDPRLRRAAGRSGQSLGSHARAGPRWRVLLPVVLPAVLANALLVFTLVVGNFAVAMVLSNKVPLLSVLTYQATVSEVGSDPRAAEHAGVISVMLVMVVLFLQRRIVGAQPARGGAGPWRRGHPCCRAGAGPSSAWPRRPWWWCRCCRW